MELKYLRKTFDKFCEARFNRTFMELKLLTSLSTALI